MSKLSMIRISRINKTIHWKVSWTVNESETCPFQGGLSILNVFALENSLIKEKHIVLVDNVYNLQVLLCFCFFKHLCNSGLQFQ